MSTWATDWTREPGRGRYARRERERRFLTRGLVPAGGARRLIEDRYLDDMRLRLRRVSGQGQQVHKLTQKVRTDEGDPSEVLITNMYLSEAEYSRLSSLPGHVLVKTRAAVAVGRHSVVVDVFQGFLTGLLLAEVEVADLAEHVDLPEWLAAEVTHDDRFCGGNLARTDDTALGELLNSL